MISSSASNPSAETVTPSPGAKTHESGGMTTFFTKTGTRSLSEEQAPKIAPERSRNNIFLIQIAGFHIFTATPGGGISGVRRKRIRSQR
jgi:hypothetical protein